MCIYILGAGHRVSRLRGTGSVGDSVGEGPCHSYERKGERRDRREGERRNKREAAATGQMIAYAQATMDAR